MRMRQENCYEFEASLCYLVSFRSAWTRVRPCQGKGGREGLEGRRKGRKKKDFVYVLG